MLGLLLPLTASGQAATILAKYPLAGNASSALTLATVPAGSIVVIIGTSRAGLRANAIAAPDLSFTQQSSSSGIGVFATSVWTATAGQLLTNEGVVLNDVTGGTIVGIVLTGAAAVPPVLQGLHGSKTVPMVLSISETRSAATGVSFAMNLASTAKGVPVAATYTLTAGSGVITPSAVVTQQTKALVR